MVSAAIESSRDIVTTQNFLMSNLAAIFYRKSPMVMSGVIPSD
jgi:hypothetical protein